MTIKKIVIYITIAALVIITLNIKLPTKQGINYDVRIYKIPLYIKLIEFIDRDYRYRELSRKIVKDMRGDRDKAMAILKWVHSNIKTDIPEGWPVYDDHIWYIIIRGYGESDQVADVFTTLSAYAGLPSGWTRVFVPGHKNSLVLSFVKINERWYIFDVFQNSYFTNDSGDIASVEDILSDRYEKESALKKINGSDLTYEDYFKYMKQYMYDIESRPRKQMLLQRILYEASNFFKPRKDMSVITRE